MPTSKVQSIKSKNEKGATVDKSNQLLAGAMIYLNYCFIFSKSANIWNRLSTFERDLADFFAAYGLEASPITTVEGSSGPRMLLITKIEGVETLVNMKGPQLTAQNSQKSSNVVNKLVSTLGVHKK